MSVRLVIVSTEYEGTVALIARGEIDISTAPELSTALSRVLTPAAPVIVDLARIDFMDSSGLRTLAEAQREARAVDCQLLIVPSPNAARVIELAGAQSAFELAATVPDALHLAHALT